MYLFVFTLVNASLSFAGPSRTTYQAKIIKPDGYPLESASVNFKFTILDPAGSCILYSETYSSVNMGNTGGLISFSLGSGVKTYPASATTFEQVFSNITASLSCDVGGPVSYSPSANDVRKIVMQFHDGAGWQTLPAMNINAVPYAMYANTAQSLNGKLDSDFVQVSTLSTCTASEALNYNGVGFSCVALPSVSAGAVVAALGFTPANGASVTTLTSSVTSANVNIAAVSATVYSVSSTVTSLQNSVAASFAAITSSQWLSSGTTISYSAGNVGIGTSSPTSRFHIMNGSSGGTSGSGSFTLESSGNTYLQILGLATGTSQIRFGDAVNSGRGNISYTHLVDNMNFFTSGTQRMMITGSGNVGIGTGSPVTKLEVSGGVRISMEPATCATSYAGTLRYNTGVVEFCNGSTWSAFGVAGAGITNMNGSTSGSQTFAMGTAGTSFHVVTTNGVHTFNIPLASAASVTGGLLSNADYANFMGKMTSSPASIAQVLGYTPASATSVGIISALGYTPASASASTQWTTSGSTIFYNSGNVGIGTPLPTSTLTVSGTGYFSNLLTVVNTGIRVLDPTQNGGIKSFNTLVLQSDDDGSSTTEDIVFKTGVSESMRIRETGNVGIGTANPSVKLDVNGAITATAGAGTINLKAGPILDHTYMQFFARSASPTTRSGYVGYPSSGTNQFNIFNEMTTGSVVLGTNGSPRVTVTATGDVGIGLSNPTARLTLDPAGSSLAPLKIVSSSLLGSPQGGAVEYDGSYYYITDSSNVRRAIATVANPGTFDNASVLSAPGNMSLYANTSVIVSNTTASTNASTGALIVKGGTGIAGDLNVSGSILTSNGMTAAGSNIDLRNTTDGSNGVLRFYSSDNVNRLGIYVGSTYARLQTYNGVPLSFITSSTERMRISDNGNVGIGTAAPASNLEIVGGHSTLGILRITTTSDVTNSGSTFVRFNDVNGSAGYVGFGGTNSRFDINSYKYGPMVFGTSNTERVRITETGNVGIGTGSPNAKLEVKAGTEGQFTPIEAIRIWGPNSPASPNSAQDITWKFASAGSTGIRSYRGGSWDSYMQFLTTAASAGADIPVVRMHINQDGMVGINTTSPIGQLTIASGPTFSAGYTRSLTLFAQHPTMQFKGISDTNHSAGIGYDAQSNSEAMRFWVGATTDDLHATGLQAMTLTVSGNVGIGTSIPSEKLEVSGSIKAVSYLYTSDERLKKDIITLPDALTKALQLRGVNFVWRNNNEKTVGFIAQEVEKVYPELVKTDKVTGFKAVQYGNIVAILVEALRQEHDERVRSIATVSEQAENRINQLEKENQDLKTRLEKIEKFLNEKVK